MVTYIMVDYLHMNVLVTPAIFNLFNYLGIFLFYFYVKC